MYYPQVNRRAPRTGHEFLTGQMNIRIRMMQLWRRQRALPRLFAILGPCFILFLLTKHFNHTVIHTQLMDTDVDMDQMPFPPTASLPAAASQVGTVKKNNVSRPKLQKYAPQSRGWLKCTFEDEDLPQPVPIPERPNGEKLILLFNHKCRHYYSEEHDIKTVFQGCPVKNCIATEEKWLAPKSDAVILLAPAFVRYFNFPLHAPVARDRLPKVRPAEQRWIFYTRESPCQSHFPKTKEARDFLGLFNWTMTFRTDSDIPRPFGVPVKRTVPQNKDFLSKAKSKQKMVAWAVSHCETWSRREDYVKELQKYIPVDIFGQCGEECGNNDKCFGNIDANYKFYLAFENSFSTDYVTEKWYRSVLYDTVIISRGGADYSRLGIKPEWHINTADFKSPKELAEYLLMLDKDPEKYVSYLNWRNEYTFEEPTGIDWCELCRKLNDPNEPPKTYSSDDMLNWFYGSTTDKTDCRLPTDLNF